MCTKRYLAFFLSVSLVASPIFSGSFGWSFLENSKKDSSISEVKVEQPTNEVLKISNEEVVQTPIVELKEEPQTTVTSTVEKKNLTESSKVSEEEITKIYKMLESYETASFRNKDEVVENALTKISGLELDIINSNQAIDTAIDLLSDYDAALYEANKLHFGFGVSGMYNKINGYAGFVDLSLRKQNVILTTSVGYPINETTFSSSFEPDKLDYRVGVAWEF